MSLSAYMHNLLRVKITYHPRKYNTCYNYKYTTQNEQVDNNAYNVYYNIYTYLHMRVV